MPSIKRRRQSVSITDLSAVPKDGTTHNVEDMCERQHTCQLGCCRTLQGVRNTDKQFDRDKDMVTQLIVTFLVNELGETCGTRCRERKCVWYKREGKKVSVKTVTNIATAVFTTVFTLSFYILI